MMEGSEGICEGEQNMILVTSWPFRLKGYCH